MCNNKRSLRCVCANKPVGRHSGLGQLCQPNAHFRSACKHVCRQATQQKVKRHHCEGTTSFLGSEGKSPNHAFCAHGMRGLSNLVLSSLLFSSLLLSSLLFSSLLFSSLLCSCLVLSTQFNTRQHNSVQHSNSVQHDRPTIITIYHHHLSPTIIMFHHAHQPDHLLIIFICMSLRF